MLKKITILGSIVNIVRRGGLYDHLMTMKIHIVTDYDIHMSFEKFEESSSQAAIASNKMS